MIINLTMDEHKPLAHRLLRIIRLLDQEEQDFFLQQQATRKYRKHRDDPYDNTKGSLNSSKKDDGEKKDAAEDSRQSHGRPSSRERRSRRDDAMIKRGKSAEGRGRTPSPKRTTAPKPPTRDCPSPLPIMVSTADVTPADQQGWLIDQLRGKKVWCVISDMLFCVFEKEDSKVSRQVVLLPGCTIRPIEFKSASQDGKILIGVARHFASKTISGVHKYQFLVENTTSNHQKLMFGVASKSEFEDWVFALEKACCVDGTTEQDNENSSKAVKPKHKHIIRRNRSRSPRFENGGENGISSPPSYSPAQTLPSRLDMNAITFPKSHNSHDVSKDSIDDIRKRLRKDNSDQDFKHIPMRVKHSAEPDNSQLAKLEDEPTRKGRALSLLKSPLGLLRRKKRSSSADDANSRRKMFPIREPDTISNPGLNPKLSGSQPSIASSVDSFTSYSTNDASFTSSTYSKDSDKSKKRGFLSRSLEFGNSLKGTRSSIRKSTSDLRDRIFKSDKTDSLDQTLSKSRSAGIKLKDIGTPTLSGYLQYRLAFKWTKVWCVLNRGCFYAFRTQKGDEFPVLSIVLNQSNVNYVIDTDKHGKRLFAFKITQRHCKSVYICAEDENTLMKWMKDVQTEAVKVQVDEMLAIEIHEKRSSQKKREAREMKEKEAKEKLDAKRAELKIKRSSCPDLGVIQQHGEDDSASKLNVDKDADRKSLNVYMGDFMTDSIVESNSKTSKDLRGTQNKNFNSNVSSDHGRITKSYHKNVPSTNAAIEIQSTVSSENSKRNTSIKKNISHDFDIKASAPQNQGMERLDFNIDTTTIFKQYKRYSAPIIKRSNSFNTVQKHHIDEKPPDAPSPVTSFGTPALHKDAGAPHHPTTVTDSAARNIDPSTIRFPKPTSLHLLQKESAQSLPTTPRTYRAFDTATPNSGHYFQPELLSSTSENDISSSLWFCNSETPLNLDDDSGHGLEDRSFGEDSFSAAGAGSDQCTDIQDSLMDSLLHDDALKQAWSMDEDFLLGVIKDKLMERRERLGLPFDEEEDAIRPVNDINGDEAVIVYDQERRVIDSTLSSEEGFGQPVDFQADQHPTYRVGHETPSLEDEEVLRTIGQDEDTEDSFMEGFLEKKVDSHWIKYWCSLKDGCLCFYVTPNDKIGADSTDLMGYTLEVLVDKFQGKRFVISLTHRDYVDILLSLDSRDELEVWQQSIQDILTSKARRQKQDESPSTPTNPESSSKESKETTAAPSVQNVKHKLLAEMLRQKMELQKIRAARSGLKTWSGHDGSSEGSPSPSPSSPSNNSGSTDDRIRTLTRLRQRRMSTQIKMSAIQKQIEESNGSARDKKVVFQLVRRRPDLVQGHSMDQSHQSDLQQQVKRLSDQLQEIDSSISSQEVTHSPRRQDVPKNKMRHSLDGSLLRVAAGQSGLPTDSHNNIQNTKGENDSLDYSKRKVQERAKNKDKYKDKGDKDKDRDVNRSNSIKSSMQQLAHRTFARANWNRLKKSSSKSSPNSNNNDKNVINALSSDSFVPVEKPPDVIDVTNNNHRKGSNGFSSLDSNIIFAPPDSFRTDHDRNGNNSNDTLTTDDNMTLPRKHRTPKERILSKLTSSQSFNHIDKIASKIKATSSPSIFKRLTKTDNGSKTKSNESASRRNSAGGNDDSSSPVPKLNLDLSCDQDEIDSNFCNPNSCPTRDRSHDYSNTNAKFYSLKRGAKSPHFHHEFHNVQENERTHTHMYEKGSLTARGSENARLRNGFYSARTERTTANPNRNSWSYSVITSSSRREVNPNTMAEIEAFEELSSKFLGQKDIP